MCARWEFRESIGKQPFRSYHPNSLIPLFSPTQHPIPSRQYTIICTHLLKCTNGWWFTYNCSLLALPPLLFAESRVNIGWYLSLFVNVYDVHHIKYIHTCVFRQTTKYIFSFFSAKKQASSRVLSFHLKMWWDVMTRLYLPLNSLFFSLSLTPWQNCTCIVFHFSRLTRMSSNNTSHPNCPSTPSYFFCEKEH